MPTRFTDRFYEVVPNKLYASATPSDLRASNRAINLKFIQENNIQVIVNLMEDDELDHDFNLFFDYAPEFSKVGIETVRFPIQDVYIPKSKAYAIEIVDFIDRKNNEGKRVLVHCWGGVGRTGTIVGCYLLRHQLANADNFMSVIAHLRKNTSIAERTSPETFTQENFVKNFLD